MYLTPIPQSRSSSPYYNPSVRYSNSSALTSDRDPSKSNYTFYNHLLATRAPGFRLTSSNSSNIGRVTIYWASVFWRRTTYASTSSSDAAKTASTNGGYSHLPYVLHSGCIPDSQRETLYWKPPRFKLIRGVVTHISEPNNITACTTVL